MRDERELIDPQNLHPACGLRTVERNALRVLDFFPHHRLTRTQDAIQIDDEEEMGVSTLVTAEAIEIRLPTVEWTGGAYGPAAASRLWKRVPIESLSDQQFVELLFEARAARRAEFIECRYCHRLVPREHRDGDVCHGCQERYEGVVH